MRTTGLDGPTGGDGASTAGGSRLRGAAAPEAKRKQQEQVKQPDVSTNPESGRPRPEPVFDPDPKSEDDEAPLGAAAPQAGS